MTVGRGDDRPAGRAATARYGIGLALAALLLIVLWGGYGGHWKWTGISGHTATLWDWLHVVLLPMAVAVLPTWVSRRAMLRRTHRSAAAVALGVFLLIVLFGYVVPWAWTGFKGNTLWNWLELLALPVAVALIPVYRQWYDGWDRRHTAVALGCVALLLVPVLGGYLGDWTWTGFRGNTFYDWLKLFLLPLLLPTLIVPATQSMATSRLPEPPPREPAPDRPRAPESAAR